MSGELIGRGLRSLREEGALQLIRNAVNYSKRRLIQLFEIPLLPFIIYEVRSRDFSDESIGENLDFAFEELYGRIRPMQSREEISGLLKILEERNVKKCR